MKKANEKIVGKSIFIHVADLFDIDNVIDAVNAGESYEDPKDIEWLNDEDEQHVIELKVVAVHKRKVTIEKVQ